MKNTVSLLAIAGVSLLAACVKTESTPAAATATAPAAPEMAAAPAAAGIEGCAKAVLAQSPGDLLQAVLKDESGSKIWEFEVRQADGKLLDVECANAGGEIVETETRVSDATDSAFAAIAKVDEATAREKALDAKAGTVERVEFEIEADGKASYEYDIQTADGDFRVEVDAASGEVVETSPELLEIGAL